jgi:hypothetical protein
MEKMRRNNKNNKIEIRCKPNRKSRRVWFMNGMFVRESSIDTTTNINKTRT